MEFLFQFMSDLFAINEEDETVVATLSESSEECVEFQNVGLVSGDEDHNIFSMCEFH